MIFPIFSYKSNSEIYTGIESHGFYTKLQIARTIMYMNFVLYKKLKEENDKKSLNRIKTFYKNCHRNATLSSSAFRIKE